MMKKVAQIWQQNGTEVYLLPIALKGLVRSQNSLNQLTDDLYFWMYDRPCRGMKVGVIGGNVDRCRGNDKTIFGSRCAVVCSPSSC